MIQEQVKTDSGEEAGGTALQKIDRLSMKVYRHSEKFKTDISRMIEAEAVTFDELMGLFFEVAQDPD